MEIKKTSSITPTKINALIFGSPGKGKTTLASTLNGKTIVLSVEAGELSLKGHPIDYAEINTLGELRDMLSEVAKSDYDNIFIDSLSSISELFLENSKKEFPEAKSTMQMYGHLLTSLKGFIKYTRDLPKNIFFTALEKVSVDEIGRRFLIPDIAGSMSTKISGYLDFVFHMDVINIDGERKRVLITETTDTVVAKDRSGELSPIEPPHLGNIINKVFS